MIIAGAVVIALMSGVVSRELTLSHPSPGPVKVVQIAQSPAPAAAPIGGENDGG